MIFKQDNDRQTGKGQYLTLTLIKHEIHDILSFMQIIVWHKYAT